MSRQNRQGGNISIGSREHASRASEHEVLDRTKHGAENSLRDDIGMVAHDKRRARTHGREAEEHRRIRNMQVNNIGLLVANLTESSEQTGAEIEALHLNAAAETSHANKTVALFFGRRRSERVERRVAAESIGVIDTNDSHLKPESRLSARE